jgi:hypothetical protein
MLRRGAGAKSIPHVRTPALKAGHKSNHRFDGAEQSKALCQTPEDSLCCWRAYASSYFLSHFISIMRVSAVFL